MNPAGLKDEQGPVLVLGLGNLLLGDEGLGVHAARALQERGGYLPGVEVLEVGTAILDALPALERADKVVVLDAITARGEPGSVYRIPLKDCRPNRSIASMHGFDIFRVFSLVRRETPPEFVVLGIEPAFIGWSLELSAPVAGALPALLEETYQEIGQCIGGSKDRGASR
jgi:hydrogenase maturation protease